MRYCQYCGKQIMEDAKFCEACGKPTEQKSTVADQSALMKTLSERIMINGIIWVAVAAIQVIFGVAAWWVLLISGLNMAVGIYAFIYAKRILTDQNGIVRTHKPLVGAIVTLVYNLLFGGVIGVVGSIYYLIFVRGFVIENERQFLEMETAAPASGGETAQKEEQDVRTIVVLTEQEAADGVQRDVFIEEFRKTLKVKFPKGIKDGQSIVLRNMDGTDRNGKTVKKDLYVRVKVKQNTM